MKRKEDIHVNYPALLVIYGYITNPHKAQALKATFYYFPQLCGFGTQLYGFSAGLAWGV